MTRAEIEYKIQNLMESGQAENNYIALCLMMSQLEMSWQEALQKIAPQQLPNPNNQDFQLHYHIGPIRLEYEYEKGYVPYMGSEISVSRMLAIVKEGQLEYELDYARFLNIDDQCSVEEVKDLIHQDYLQLLPMFRGYLGF